MEAPAAPDGTYRDQLVAAALDARLYDDPYWHILGHYRPRWVGGYASLIDDPMFFLDPRGKYDPRAELIATIRGFFDPLPDDPAVRHAVCRFPARLAWLKDKLSIDSTKLPVPVCEDVERVYDYMKPNSVTLVFPTAYMNSPASMFGHTLLVFDPMDKNRLLAKGVGYAAAVTTGFGPLFAIEGIFGVYPGRYNIESYFEKVEQYNDIHRRDIWEYELDFTQEEVDRVFRHTWELQNIWSRYYFFDENCAYKLYQLLDAARPGLKLSDDPSWFVIPIDTVKRIKSRGIVRKTEFRPSKATRMEQLAARLPPAVRQQALLTAKGKQDPAALADDQAIPVAERRLALDLSADYAQYLFTERILAHDDYTRRYFDILRTRSRLGPREEQDFAIAEPSHPESGHPASAISPGVAFENGDASLSLSGRVAYHGLLDNDSGFTRGAQILFLNTEARWSLEHDDLEIRNVDIVNVESLAPRDDLFAPSSWRARLGFTQMDIRDHQDSMVFIAQTGSGLAWETSPRNLLFTMVEAEIHIGDRYTSEIAGGPGYSIGIIHSATENLKWLTRARTAWIYEGDDDWWRAEAFAGFDYRISPARSVRVYYQFTRNDTHDINEGNAAFNVYF